MTMSSDIASDDKMTINMVVHNVSSDDTMTMMTLVLSVSPLPQAQFCQSPHFLKPSSVSLTNSSSPVLSPRQPQHSPYHQFIHFNPLCLTETLQFRFDTSRRHQMKANLSVQVRSEQPQYSGYHLQLTTNSTEHSPSSESASYSASQ